VDLVVHAARDHEQGIVGKGHQGAAVDVAAAVAVLRLGHERALDPVAVRAAEERAGVFLEVIDRFPAIPARPRPFGHLRQARTQRRQIGLKLVMRMFGHRLRLQGGKQDPPAHAGWSG